MASKLYSLNTAAVHLKYELPLYIAILHSSKTMHKLALAIAVAAGIGMNNAFAYRALIAIAPLCSSATWKHPTAICVRSSAGRERPAVWALIHLRSLRSAACSTRA
jgi:hypothetical protein